MIEALIKGASPIITIENTIIENNQNSGSSPNNKGAGIFIKGNDSSGEQIVLISNSEIRGNKALTAPAVFSHYAKVKLQNVLISGNYFLFNGKVSPKKKNFILPQDEKFLAVFNVKSSSKIYRPSFKISAIKWKRLKKAERKEFIEKTKKYFNFEIKDIKFKSNIFSSYGDKKPQSEIQFTVTNNTLYDFYEVGFILATYSGPSLTSINYYKVIDFPKGKTLSITKRWTGVVPRPSEIIITPDIPIWDEGIIKPLPHEPGIPK